MVANMHDYDHLWLSILSWSVNPLHCWTRQFPTRFSFPRGLAICTWECRNPKNNRVIIRQHKALSQVTFVSLSVASSTLERSLRSNHWIDGHVSWREVGSPLLVRCRKSMNLLTPVFLMILAKFFTLNSVSRGAVAAIRPDLETQAKGSKRYLC